MQTASSAKRTWSAFLSASEYTATVAMPSSLQASMIRRAISPRLAMRILRNIVWAGPSRARTPQVGGAAIRRLLFLAGGAQREKRLAILDGLAVFDKDSRHFPADVRLNLVHEFHGFDDAHCLARLNMVSDFHEWRCFRARRRVERADDRRLDEVIFLGCGRRDLRRPRHALRRRYWDRWRRQSRNALDNGGRRHRQRQDRSGTRLRDGLLQPYSQVAVGVFELLQPMLRHERKQALE